jgi:hypothetical protein
LGSCFLLARVEAIAYTTKPPATGPDQSIVKAMAMYAVFFPGVLRGAAFAAALVLVERNGLKVTRDDTSSVTTKKVDCQSVRDSALREEVRDSMCFEL